MNLKIDEPENDFEDKWKKKIFSCDEETEPDPDNAK